MEGINLDDDITLSLLFSCYCLIKDCHGHIDSESPGKHAQCNYTGGGACTAVDKLLSVQCSEI